jgi:hypothetical protein
MHRGEMQIMCCGQKRLELSNDSTRTNVRHIPSNTHTSFLPPRLETNGFGLRHITSQIPTSGSTFAGARSFQPTVSLRYVRGSPVRVRGSLSGRYYEFSGSRPVQAVQARDAELLLRTHLFQRV